MKVTVTKNLNVRVGAPSLNAPCYQYLAPGSEIEVVETFHKGDAYDGIDTWLKDEADNYYWIGGIDYNSKTREKRSPISVINYNELINLPTEIQKTNGREILIGIIDSGCYDHPALKLNIMNGRNFVDSSSSFDDISYESHGTFVSGIIAANKIESCEMIGVAPEAKLLIAKISDQRSITDPAAVLKSLEWLIRQNPNIINLSFDFYPGDLKQEFEKIFQTLSNMKIILVAAGRDNDGLFMDRGLYYPSTGQNIIAIGSINRTTYLRNITEKINPKIKYIVEEIKFTSCNKYGIYSTGLGSSFAAALTTGSLALILSYLKQMKDEKDAITMMDSLISSLSQPDQLNNHLTIFRL